MELSFRQLNPHACQTYLIGVQGSNEVALVDPVLDHFQDYLKLLRDEALKLSYVIDTHTHADHISCGPALKDFTECEYLLHEYAPSKCATQRIHNNDVLDLMGIKVRAIYTPGHTKDSISLLFSDRILTGDALFLDDGGAGRDDLPGGDPAEHWDSIQKFLALPDHLVVYPAHEYRKRVPSNLARQKISNPHLQPRTKEEFIIYINDLKLGPAEWMKDVLKTNYACAQDPKSAWIPVDVPACEIKGTMDKNVNEIDVRSISVEDLNRRLGSEGESLPILLDVREIDELVSDLGHLNGTTHIPIGSLIHRMNELEKDKNKEIVTVCRSGARAYTAAQILTKSDFKNISVLDGGMLRWNQLKLPVDRKWNK